MFQEFNYVTLVFHRVLQCFMMFQVFHRVLQCFMMFQEFNDVS